MDPRIIEITSPGLSVGVSTLGAELAFIRDANGADLLWNGDPAVWAGRAPILFPIIGMLANGRYRLGGRSYALAKHGFARGADFQTVEKGPDEVVMRLTPNAATWEAYPFAFQLDLRFAVSASRLKITATIANHGAAPMPASFGFHPAFRWPLPYGEPRRDHFIQFAAEETGPLRRINRDGLLTSALLPTPIKDGRLTLRDALFDDDALIFDPIKSRSVTYGAGAGPRIRIGYNDLPNLGVWTKPGAGYICIEPWQGVADPEGFEGEIWEKPGIIVIAPGAARDVSIEITLEP